jgi:hypothetical protein
MTREDFLINIPDELSPSDIVEESYEWAGQRGILVAKFQRENIRPRPESVRVTVHLKNIPLRMWSHATVTRILEDFGESVFIDDVCMEGTDRRAVYAMVDCHDDRMIPKSIMVHAGDKWEIVFVRVIDWALVGAPPPLENDHLYGRNQNGEFRAEAQARKSLARGMDRLRGYFNRFGGPNAESTDEEQDMMEEGMVAKEIEVKFARGGGR